jgi:hypothetical protein
LPQDPPLTRWLRFVLGLPGEQRRQLSDLVEQHLPVPVDAIKQALNVRLSVQQAGQGPSALAPSATRAPSDVSSSGASLVAATSGAHDAQAAAALVEGRIRRAFTPFLSDIPGETRPYRIPSGLIDALMLAVRENEPAAWAALVAAPSGDSDGKQARAWALGAFQRLGDVPRIRELLASARLARAVPLTLDALRHYDRINAGLGELTRAISAMPFRDLVPADVRAVKLAHDQVSRLEPDGGEAGGPGQGMPGGPCGGPGGGQSSIDYLEALASGATHQAPVAPTLDPTVGVLFAMTLMRSLAQPWNIFLLARSITLTKGGVDGGPRGSAPVPGGRPVPQMGRQRGTQGAQPGGQTGKPGHQQANHQQDGTPHPSFVAAAAHLLDDIADQLDWLRHIASPGSHESQEAALAADGVVGLLHLVDPRARPLLAVVPGATDRVKALIERALSDLIGGAAIALAAWTIERLPARGRAPGLALDEGVRALKCLWRLPAPPSLAGQIREARDELRTYISHAALDALARADVEGLSTIEALEGTVDPFALFLQGLAEEEAAGKLLSEARRRGRMKAKAANPGAAFLPAG